MNVPYCFCHEYIEALFKLLIFDLIFKVVVSFFENL